MSTLVHKLVKHRVVHMCMRYQSFIQYWVSFTFSWSFVIDLALMTMLAFFIFTKGYYALCKGPSHALNVKIYYICQAIMCVLFFIFTITRGGCFNGFARLPGLKECELNFSYTISIFEILMYYASIVIGAFCLWKTK